MLLDTIHDAIQLFLEQNNTKKAIEIFQTQIIGKIRNYSKENLKCFFNDLMETCYYELQSGVDPLTIYAFLFYFNKQINATQASEKCLDMINLYKKMKQQGWPYKDINQCRLLFEQKNWEVHALNTSEQREASEASIGYWRQDRLLSSYDLLLQNFPNNSWLTVGDARHAYEARYINKKGGNATPSDITDHILKQTKAAKLIDRYQVENVEHLTATDNSFDFVAAKDMLHHCSRPLVAIHEMLRVAKKGICFIEPFDYSCLFSDFFPMTTSHPRLKNWHGFEEGIGNYIYSFSDREIAKICMGLGIPFLAYKGFYDLYDKKIDSVNIKENPEAEEFKKYKQATIEIESAIKQGNGVYNLIAFVILKQPPTKRLKKAFLDDGFIISQLTPNYTLERALLAHPYLQREDIL